MNFLHLSHDGLYSYLNRVLNEGVQAGLHVRVVGGFITFPYACMFSVALWLLGLAKLRAAALLSKAASVTVLPFYRSRLPKQFE